MRAPALVLHGTGDAVVPFDQGRLLAALIPDARFVSLESRNHVLLESEPAWTRFTDEVRRFLADGARDGGSVAPRATDAPLNSARLPAPPRSAPPTRRR